MCLVPSKKGFLSSINRKVKMIRRGQGVKLIVCVCVCVCVWDDRPHVKFISILIG